MQEILRGFFILDAKHERRIGCAGYIVSEAATDLKQLGCALKSEQECDIRAARSDQDVSEVLISEWRELVHDYADKGCSVPFWASA